PRPAAPGVPGLSGPFLTRSPPLAPAPPAYGGRRPWRPFELVTMNTPKAGPLGCRVHPGCAIGRGGAMGAIGMLIGPPAYDPSAMGVSKIRSTLRTS